MTKIPQLSDALRRKNIASMVVNGIGALTTYFYLSIIDPLPTAERSVASLNKISVFIFIIIVAFAFYFGMNLGNKVEKNIKKWYELISTGEKESDEIPENVQRDILNTSLYSAAITALIWVLVSIIFGLLNQSFRVFVGIILGGGLIAVVMDYFVGDLIWRPIIPFFFPKGNLSQIRAFRLSVLGKLLIVFLFIGILPPTLLVSLSGQRAQILLDAPNPETVLANLRLLQIFILSASVVTSIGLAIFTTRSITGPLDILREAMGRVGENDLEAQVLVTNNDELGYLGEYFNQMTAGLRQNEMLRNLLNIYVSPEVAQEALNHGTELGGELIECTVLFSDIRGFTSISEALLPEKLMILLNRYMSMMVEIIVGHGGMVNKFGGDSLLAVFGTPLNPAEDHAAQALRSAQQMFRALKEFNRAGASEGLPAIGIGVGIATGPVVAGNIGGRERIEYTVIGDTVNLASRLEGKTRDVEGSILVSEKTYRQASQALDLQAHYLSEIMVKGKKEAVGAYIVDVVS